MVKIKLKIDPAKPEQVDALNLLLLAIGMQAEAKYPKPIGHSIGFEQGKDGIKVTTQLADIEEAQNRFVHDMVETAKEAEQPKVRKVKETFIPKEKSELNIFEQAVTEEPNLDHPMETKDDTGPTATLEQIREVLGKKVTEHRDAIKAKLTEFGAKNVSVLDTAKYSQFFNFLTEL